MPFLSRTAGLEGKKILQGLRKKKNSNPSCRSPLSLTALTSPAPSASSQQDLGPAASLLPREHLGPWSRGNCDVSALTVPRASPCAGQQLGEHEEHGEHPPSCCSVPPPRQGQHSTPTNPYPKHTVQTDSLGKLLGFPSLFKNTGEKRALQHLQAGPPAPGVTALPTRGPQH